MTLALLGSLGAAGCSLKSTFINESYPKGASKVFLPSDEELARQRSYGWAAALVPIAATGYDRPRAAGRCWSALMARAGGAAGEVAGSAPAGSAAAAGSAASSCAADADVGSHAALELQALGRCIRVGTVSARSECLATTLASTAPDDSETDALRRCMQQKERERLVECLQDSPFMEGGDVACRASVGQEELTTLDAARVLRSVAEIAEAVDGQRLLATGFADAVVGAPVADASAGSSDGAGPDGAPSPVLPADDQCYASLAVDAAVRLLAQSPDALERRPPARLPALALSGGAADGAFTAGYVHALLDLRESVYRAALERSRTGRGVERLEAIEVLTELDRQHRFSATVGTSVGALVSLPVDLYFAAPPTAPSSAYAEELPRCLGGRTAPAGRELQECALARLEDLFVQTDEWDLLCAERGGAGKLVGLIGKGNHLLRFDPLDQRILAPFFEAFGDVMADNDVIRVAMAVELANNAVFGLDERACRDPAMSPEQARECARQAVMASVAQPVFVPYQPVVHSGLLGAAGEPGTWYDGGLRSGTPAHRTVLLAGESWPDGAGRHAARGRRASAGAPVLAVTTTRADGGISKTPELALGVLLGTLKDLVQQTRQWELAYAAELVESRGARLDRILRMLARSSAERPSGAADGAAPGGPSDGSASDGSASDGSASDGLASDGSASSSTATDPTGPAPRGDASRSTAPQSGGGTEPSADLLHQAKPTRAPLGGAHVLAMFIPEGSTTHLLGASGYQFYPFFMRGLFALGRQALVQSRLTSTTFLGWGLLADGRLPGDEEPLPWVVDAIEAWEARTAAAAAQVLAEGDYERLAHDPEAIADRYAERRKELGRCLALCSRDGGPVRQAPRCDDAD